VSAETIHGLFTEGLSNALNVITNTNFTLSMRKVLPYFRLSFLMKIVKHAEIKSKCRSTSRF
jgi:hypothetical protein